MTHIHLRSYDLHTLAQDTYHLPYSGVHGLLFLLSLSTLYIFECMLASWTYFINLTFCSEIFCTIQWNGVLSHNFLLLCTLGLFAGCFTGQDFPWRYGGQPLCFPDGLTEFRLLSLRMFLYGQIVHKVHWIFVGSYLEWGFRFSCCL